MYQHYFKRLLDCVMAFLLLIILSPLFLIIGIMVKVKLGSPVFFMQERPGLNCEVFKMYKFRSMTDERDQNNNLLSDEQRLTKFGKYLRKTSLDEVPELLNIVKGDMSFVGPRPLLVKYLPLYNERQIKRHNVRPGITGFAQVNGRNSIKWEEKFDLDLYYISHLTFLMDIKILFKTIKVVFSSKGISSETSSTMEEFKGDL